MTDTRHRLLQRLDTIEKRIARLTAADPSLKGLENRIEEQRTERDEARARLAALDEKVARLTARPVAPESAVRETVHRQLDRRVSSAGESAQERIMKRVARLETAVAAQHTAIVELRDCSIKTEETMQKLLNSVDSMVSRSVHRTSR